MWWKIYKLMLEGFWTVNPYGRTINIIQCHLPYQFTNLCNKNQESLGFEDSGRCSRFCHKYRSWWPPITICDSVTIYFSQYLYESFCSISAVVWKYLWQFQCNGISASILFCLTFHYQPTHTHTHKFPNESPIIQKIHYSEVMNVFCRSTRESK